MYTPTQSHMHTHIHIHSDSNRLTHAHNEANQVHKGKCTSVRSVNIYICIYTGYWYVYWVPKPHFGLGQKVGEKHMYILCVYIIFLHFHFHFFYVYV